jgi:hypothetical protein
VDHRVGASEEDDRQDSEQEEDPRGSEQVHSDTLRGKVDYISRKGIRENYHLPVKSHLVWNEKSVRPKQRAAVIPAWILYF